MSSFWSGIVVAIIIALGANVVLGAIQKPVDSAFVTQGVRL